eukprot:1650932-Pyramimonas_sp.AAC.1
MKPLSQTPWSSTESAQFLGHPWSCSSPAPTHANFIGTCRAQPHGAGRRSNERHFRFRLRETSLCAAPKSPGY